MADSATGPLYTCVTCHVAFRDPENQRNHFQTEWHSYNLKRKVAILKPVTKEEFEAKLQAQELKTKQEESKASFTTSCVICNKNFSNEKTYLNHLASKRHKENELNWSFKPREEKKPKEPAGQGEEKRQDGEEEEENSELTEEELVQRKIDNAKKLDPEDCLFCRHRSSTFEENLDHMAVDHSFFIPDLEYIVDLEGLIKYLGEKVGTGNVCLYCNERGRSFHSLEAVQQHMVTKGHCKLFYEGDADQEYSDYYDFRPSYPDYKEGEEMDDEEIDEDDNAPIISENEMELTLPSGKVLGHRSLNRYYKQKFKIDDDDRTSVQVSRLMAQYRALGWNEAKSASSHEQIMGLRDRERFQMGLGVRANRLQRHFRRQVDF